MKMTPKRVIYYAPNKTLESYKLRNGKSLYLFNWKGLKYSLYASILDFKKDKEVISFETKKDITTFAQRFF